MSTPDYAAAAIAGLAGGAAFTATLEADLRITGNNVDDFILLGRPFVQNRKHARIAGAAIHVVNSVGLACLYAMLEQRLPGPPWLKGTLFANVENVMLYPALMLEEFHPAIQDGQVDSYFTWPSFWQSVLRHVAYGLIVGVIYARLRKTQPVS